MTDLFVAILDSDERDILDPENIDEDGFNEAPIFLSEYAAVSYIKRTYGECNFSVYKLVEFSYWEETTTLVRRTP